MTALRITIVAVCMAVFISACSKKQEDAAQLEHEMLGDTTAIAIDTAVPEPPPTQAQMPAPDAGAIPAEEEISLPSQPPGQGFTVQVAGCTDQKYADYLVKKFAKRGYEPFVSTTVIEGATYYRVRIGLVATFGEAKSIKAELEDRFSRPVWIDVIN